MITKANCKCYLLEEDENITVPSEWGLDLPFQHLKLDSLKARTPDVARYGKCKAIYHLWKTVSCKYIVFGVGNILPTASDEDLSRLSKGELHYIVPKLVCTEHLQEFYRANYYGYDFSLLISYLKRFHPEYAAFAKEEVLISNDLYFLCGVFEKKYFDAFCSFLFKTLEQLDQLISVHASPHQNRSLEHLAPYLFTIYAKYHAKDIPYAAVQALPLVSDRTEEEIKAPEIEGLTVEDAELYIDQCIAADKLILASKWARRLPTDRSELSHIREAFHQYERERRIQKTTHFDWAADWRIAYPASEGAATPRVHIASHHVRMLVVQWNSIGHDVNVDGLKRFGFDCTTFNLGFSHDSFDEQLLEQLSIHLERNQYDIVFSLNCIGPVAEACYLNNIPYVSWCYDSPSFTGRRWFLYYPTTHVFLFDSDDARHYREAGVKQSHFMPLATNVSFWERVLSGNSHRDEYCSEISFVGSLYETTLPEAMAYLSDDRRSFLNALIDMQMDVYGHSFFDEIFSDDLIQWLGNPEFNRSVHYKKGAKEIPDELGNGKMRLTMCAQTTNRERLLLLNLLAKHYEVMLYSYHNDEALKNLTYRGKVQYSTQMPFVFANSRINLNATLRSIVNGVPLRCLDVMGCHGLLVTNYQKDFEEHFVDEKNLLFYTCAEEALEKARFYIEHETQRQKIAEAGFQTVKEFYDYPVKLNEIFHTDGLDDYLPRKWR